MASRPPPPPSPPAARGVQSPSPIAGEQQGSPIVIASSSAVAVANGVHHRRSHRRPSAARDGRRTIASSRTTEDECIAHSPPSSGSKRPRRSAHPPSSSSSSSSFFYDAAARDEIRARFRSFSLLLLLRCRSLLSSSSPSRRGGGKGRVSQPHPLVVIAAVAATCFFLYVFFLLSVTAAGALLRRRRRVRPPPLVDMSRFGYRPRPRALKCYVVDHEDNNGIGPSKVERIPVYPTVQKRRSNLQRVDVSDDYNDKRALLKNSKKYRRGRTEPFETDQCKAMRPWQLKSFPNCNVMHELDPGSFYERDGGSISSRPEKKVQGGKKKKGKRKERRVAVATERVRLVNNGYWRDVWSILNSAVVSGPSSSNGSGLGHPGGIIDGVDVSAKEEEKITERVTLKTLRYNHEFEERNVDRHRRDALASERLTSSRHVVDIFSFCGASSLYEYADGGDAMDAVWGFDDDVADNGGEEKKSGGGKGEDEKEDDETEDDNEGSGGGLAPLDKLHIAAQAALGLYDAHSVDRGDDETGGGSTIAHTDISPSQFILVDGFYKLNDFNRCRFMRIDRVTNEPCGYYVGSNPGKFRSPEEYEYDEQTEKVDIYSLGNVLYVLLTEEWPFHDKDSMEASKLVIEGKRPVVRSGLGSSDDPAIVALRKAMDMCWTHDAAERAAAKELYEYLASELTRIDPTRVVERLPDPSSWGRKRR